MRLDDVTRTDVGTQLDRLKGAYPGAKMEKKDLNAFADELLLAVKNWTRQELTEAISDTIQSSEYFPRISVICSHRPKRDHAKAAEQAVASGSTCRRCHQVAFVAAYECRDGRVVDRYRCECDPAQPGWHTPAAAQRNEQLKGPKLLNPAA